MRDFLYDCYMGKSFSFKAQIEFKCELFIQYEYLPVSIENFKI